MTDQADGTSARGTRTRVTLRTDHTLAGGERAAVVYWMTRALPPVTREDKPTGPLRLATHRIRRQTPESGPRPPGAGWRSAKQTKRTAGSGPVGTGPHWGPPADVMSMLRDDSGGAAGPVNHPFQLRLL
jgi:hypothetical protein